MPIEIADLKSQITNLTKEVVDLKKTIKYVFQKYNHYELTDEDVESFVDQMRKEE